MMDKESIDIMIAQANAGMQKFMPNQKDRQKILTDGYMDLDIEASIEKQDPRVQQTLFQIYEGMRAKLSIVPTHITYIIHDDTHITFRFHILRETITANDDLFKTAIMKLECATSDRPAQLSKEEYENVMAYHIKNPAEPENTWNGKPYIVKT